MVPPAELPIAVHVTGDDPLLVEGLEAILAAEPGLRVIADLSMADGPVVELRELEARMAAEHVAEEGDHPLILLVADPGAARDALASGARGVLDRATADGRALAAAIRAVSAGLLVLDPAFAARALPAHGSAHEFAHDRVPLPELLDPLTARELEVLSLLAEGLSNRAIARHLGMSEHTAKFHVNSILGKLDAATRTEAVVRATRLGLLVL